MPNFEASLNALAVTEDILGLTLVIFSGVGCRAPKLGNMNQPDRRNGQIDHPNSDYKILGYYKYKQTQYKNKYIELLYGMIKLCPT